MLISKKATFEMSNWEAGRVENNMILTGLAGKNPSQEKTKTYLDTPSLWCKRTTLKEEGYVSLFEFGAIVPAVLNLFILT